MSIPFGLLPFARSQWFGNDGTPLAGGSLTFSIAGLSTPKAVYADSAGVTSLGAVVTLDSAGRPVSGVTPTNIYLAPGGYKVILADSLNNPIWTSDNVEDVGSSLFGSLGSILATGARAVANNYTSLSSDNFVTVNSSSVNPTVFNLQAASTRIAPNGAPLFVQNVGTNAVNVTPHGTDTINGVNALKALPAISGGNQPTFMLLCDGVSAWWIVASFATSTAASLGVWDGTRTVNTVYQAATDGFVTCFGFATADMTNAFISGATDGANPPGTTRAQAYLHRLDSVPVNVPGCYIMFPVRKGDYWEITTGVTGSIITTVYWLPLGS